MKLCKDPCYTVAAATFVVAASDSLHKERADYVCDGVDDQVEIQEAIDALRYGGVVQLLEGKFNISAPITDPSQNGTVIRGAGGPGFTHHGTGGVGGTLLYLDNGANCNMFEFTQSAKHIFFPAFKDLGLYGNKSNQSGTSIGIKITGEYTDIYFENIIIYDFLTDGILLNPEAGNMWNVWLKTCLIEDNTTGVHLVAGSYRINMVNVCGCHFVGYSEDGILFESGYTGLSPNYALNISTSRFRSSTGNYGLRLSGVKHVKVRSSDFLNHKWHGIYIDKNGSVTSDHISILGCDISDWQAIHTQQAAVRIKDGAGDYIHVINCEMHNNTISPIYMALPEDNPHGRIYEKHISLFMDVLVASATHVHAAITGTGAEQEITTAITNPDVPRNISITNSANSTGDVKIDGVDAKGNTVSDTITIVTGGIAYGVVPFATVSKITIPATVANPDTISVGISDKLGLSNAIYASGDVYKVKVNNADDPTIGTANTTYNTVDCATINAGDDITIWYKSNLNIIS